MNQWGNKNRRIPYLMFTRNSIQHDKISLFTPQISLL
jgi:hypothetical protein